VGRENTAGSFGSPDNIGANPSKNMVPCSLGQTRMKYDGHPDKIGVSPHLNAKLGARKIEVRGCSPM